MFAIFVFSSVEDGLIGGVLNKYSFRLVGLWSYSIFMVHTIVISLTNLILEYIFDLIASEFSGLEVMLFSVFVITITPVLTSLTYKYIEVPFRDKAKLYAKQFLMPKLAKMRD